MFRQTLTIRPGTPATVDPDALHKAVMAGWAHQFTARPEERHRLGILFAANLPPQARPGADAGAATHVLVQGATAPVWDADGPLTPLVDPFPYTMPALAAGDRVDLAVTVHPTRAEAATHRHKPISDPTGIAEWFSRRLTSAVTIAPDQVRIMRHGAPVIARRGFRIGLYTLTATGTVIDPDRVGVLVAGGVGRGKAYGAGLLRVRVAH